MKKRRFALALDAALLMAKEGAKPSEDCSFVAPTLLRSQTLSQLYSSVRNGGLQRREAETQLDYLRKLTIRFLGDRVLQRVSWDIASKLDFADTYLAEYIAVTQLQADALVTLDPKIIAAARTFVPLATINDITVPMQLGF